MFKNIYKIALRNLLRKNSHGLTNILGLSIGIASTLVIIMYCINELSHDSMHPNADNTYVLGYAIEAPNFSGAFPGGPAGIDNYLKETFPSVTNNVGFELTGMPTTIKYKPMDKIVMTEEIIWAEPNFNEMYYMEVIKGSREEIMPQINSIVLTETAAKTLFGDREPINEVVSLSHMFATDSTEISLLVTAVIKDFPANSYLRPDYIVNHQARRQFVDNPEDFDRWDPNLNLFTQSFFVCENPDDIPLIKEDIQSKVDEAIAANGFPVEVEIVIQNIQDVHFDDAIDWSQSVKSADKRYIYIFIAIAIMILAVACINYINMTTARSVRRAKEIGLRKTFGSGKLYLMTQFMMESFMTVLIAGVLALLLVIVFLPYFNDLTQKDFVMSDLFSVQILTTFAAIILFTTLIAGLYPALYMTGFQPAAVLKGNFSQKSNSGMFRKILTTLQFCISIVLIVSSLVIIKQLNLMQSSKLNEAGEQVVSIRYGGFNGPVTIPKYQVYKNELSQNPAIEYVTLANHLPRLDYFGPIRMDYKMPDLGEDVLQWKRLNGDYDFPKTFDMELIAGRYFEDGNTSDSSTYILNETAVKKLKMSPDEVIGKTLLQTRNLNFGGDSDFANAIVGTVIGVVKDFPYESGYNEIEPLVVTPRPRNDDLIIHVRLTEGDFSSKLTFLEETWRKLYPEYGFDYWFIDDEFHRMYVQENQIADMTKNFTFLAILLTCFGVYGLSSFMAQQKIKEVGIRKVLGANTAQIAYIMVITFIRLILVASLIAIPLATYLVYQYWLQDFSLQIGISLDVILIPTFVVLTITFLTMGWETYKAATANPVESLKYE